MKCFYLAATSFDATTSVWTYRPDKPAPPSDAKVREATMRDDAVKQQRERPGQWAYYNVIDGHENEVKSCSFS